MKRLFSLVLITSLLSLSSRTYAGCSENYQKKIDQHYNNMSFNQDRLDSNTKFLYKPKDKMFYNDGKGRSILGAIVNSTGRVVVSTTTGAIIGYAAPFALAGAVAAVPIGIMLLFVLPTFGLVLGALPDMVQISGTWFKAMIPATLGPYVSIAGAGLLGARSIVLSSKDAILAVKIRNLYNSKEMISAANAGNKFKFKDFYKKFPKSVKETLNLKEAMELISKHDKLNSFCLDEETPMSFANIKKALKDDLLGTEVAMSVEDQEIDQDDIVAVETDEEVPNSIIVEKDSDLIKTTFN